MTAAEKRYAAACKADTANPSKATWAEIEAAARLVYQERHGKGIKPMA